MTSLVDMLFPGAIAANSAPPPVTPQFFEGAQPQIDDLALRAEIARRMREATAPNANAPQPVSQPSQAAWTASVVPNEIKPIQDRLAPSAPQPSPAQPPAPPPSSPMDAARSFSGQAVPPGATVTQGTLAPQTQEAPQPRNPVSAPVPAQTAFAAPRAVPEALARIQNPNVSTGDSIAAFFAGAGDRGQGVLARLAGGFQAQQQLQQQRLAQNATYNALIKKKVDPDTALALISDPKLLATLAPQIFGIEKPSHEKLNYGERLIRGNPDGTFSDVTPGGSQGGNPNLTGEEFLATLPADAQPVVKRIAEGRSAALPQGRGGYNAQIMQWVSQYKPDYDQSVYPNRAKAKAEFYAGGPNSPAGAITSGNTAIDHLSKLSDAARNLNNSDWGLIANWVPNQLSGLTGGSAAIKEFNTARDRFTEEATKFYRGIGGSEADIKRTLDNLSAASSPRELQTAIKAEQELMQSKVNALQERWHNALGPMADDFPVISNHSQGALENVRRNYEAAYGRAAPLPQPTPSAKGGMMAAPAQTAAPNLPNGDPLNLFGGR